MINNPIQIGDKAPVFQTRDIWNNTVEMPEANQWTFLSFHRFAACPFCNLRTHALIQAYPEFEKHNIQIISIWPSTQQNMLKFVGQEQSPFPLVSDPQKQLFQQYRVVHTSKLRALKLFLHPKLIVQALRKTKMNMEIDADPSLMPASFLIDSSGIIRMAYYGEHYGDHVDIQTIFSIKNKN